MDCPSCGDHVPGMVYVEDAKRYCIEPYDPRGTKPINYCPLCGCVLSLRSVE